jgi:hypothetical protein
MWRQYDHGDGRARTDHQNQVLHAAIYRCGKLTQAGKLDGECAAALVIVDDTGHEFGNLRFTQTLIQATNYFAEGR